MAKIWTQDLTLVKVGDLFEVWPESRGGAVKSSVTSSEDNDSAMELRQLGLAGAHAGLRSLGHLCLENGESSRNENNFLQDFIVLGMPAKSLCQKHPNITLLQNGIRTHMVHLAGK